MNEVLGTLDALKSHPIDYDDIFARKLIVFKGGIEKTVSME